MDTNMTTVKEDMLSFPRKYGRGHKVPEDAMRAIVSLYDEFYEQGYRPNYILTKLLQEATGVSYSKQLISKYRVSLNKAE